MKTNMRKEIIGDELYLYNSKGELIFKKWLKQGYSYVFSKGFTYDRNTLVSITEKDGKINHEKR